MDPLRLLIQIGEILAGTEPAEEAMASALEALIRGLGSRSGWVLLLDPDADTFRPLAQQPPPEESALQMGSLTLDYPLYASVARSRVPAMIQSPELGFLDASDNSSGRDAPGRQIAVPLLASGQVQGLLLVSSPEERCFEGDVLELLRAVSGQMGPALAVLRLQESLAQSKRIEEHHSEVTEQIASELELDRILPNVLRVAEELIQADGGGIALIHEKDGSIHYPYLHNLPQALAHVPISPDSGVAGQAITRGEAVWIADYASDARAIPSFVAAGVRSAIAVPIRSGSEILGSLMLARSGNPKRFTEQDAEALHTIGRQAAIAIKNARLYENMRFYTRQITRAQEEERKRIAREIHDETIQMLIVVLRKLESLVAVDTTLSGETAEALTRLQGVVVETISGVRRFVRDLRPPALDLLGLVAAVEGLASDLMERHDIQVDLQVTGERRRLTPEQELVLFRIAQEAMNNIRRHSRATEARIGITFYADQVKLIIQDNGQGFSAPGHTDDLVAKGRLGLAGMGERARTLGGSLAIDSSPQEGTVITAQVPTLLDGPKAAQDS